MHPRFKVAIPARLGSTRLPRKPLADIGGKPMVVRVAERAQASGADEVWIATDSTEIEAAAHSFGIPVRLTSSEHTSGSDRIAELTRLLGWSAETIVVNVQGDEPLVAPGLIRAVALELDSHRAAVMATACHPLRDQAEFEDPHAVKVVCDAAGYASYFSRAPIPYPRDGGPIEALRHLGIYAYRVEFLRCFTELPPAPTERTEALEQLRALWHGYRIAVVQSDEAPSPGVDTEQDLARVRALFEKTQA